MKNKFVLINSLMSVVILFAILFQSMHSFEHLTKQLTEKKCLHKHVSDKQITHQHKILKQCFVCEFAFSSFIDTNTKTFLLTSIEVFFKQVSFYNNNSITCFNGISYPLRGPPHF